MIIRVFMAAIACAAFATSASAVTISNGVILFNQADALAGNVTPGDAPGFPVTLSIAGTYRLSGNLAPSAGTDGIDVTAPEVTLDLFGFRIAGSGTAVNGINGHQRALTVQNGSIRGFTSSGILVTGDFLVVSGIRSTNNHDGVASYGTKSTRIIESTLSNNSFNGAFCGDDCSVINSTLSYNNIGGANVGSNSLVLGNVLNSNARYGIFAQKSNGTVGYGSNVIVGNGIAPTGGNSPLIQLQPNSCIPSC